MNLVELQEEAANCRLCDLCNNRQTPVFAKGNPEAPIMICGMCPGPDENSTFNEEGWPFVGRSGKLLDDILHDVNLSYKDVYITNVVKCFLTPGIRLEDKWIDHCFPYLVGQICEVKPKIILGLGADAGRALLNKPKSVGLSSMRGYRYKFTEDISIIVSYHPSYFLRSGGRQHQHYGRILDDFVWIKEILSR